MPRNYNHIYSKLVEGEYDILGHIAYSIYKQQKIDHIEDFKKENGKEPSDQELIPFNKFTLSKTSIEGYRIQAERILQSFTDNILEETIIEVENDCKKNQSELLNEIIKPIKPPSKGRFFWNGVLQSIIGAFMFSAIIAVFVIINQTRDKGIESVIENTFDIRLVKPSPTNVVLQKDSLKNSNTRIIK
ncbi:MAG: hypothetical protein RBR97_13215 [Bacteroidales bacterium]|jgi:hypothetical protein|nr:hypothetical protein [Bacteroidales bacterium]